MHYFDNTIPQETTITIGGTTKYFEYLNTPGWVYNDGIWGDNKLNIYYEPVVSEHIVEELDKMLRVYEVLVIYPADRAAHKLPGLVVAKNREEAMFEVGRLDVDFDPGTKIELIEIASFKEYVNE